MHEAENALVHDTHNEVITSTEGIHALLEQAEPARGIGKIHGQDHVEIPLHRVLGNFTDVRAGISESGCDLGQDTGAVLADGGHHHSRLRASRFWKVWQIIESTLSIGSPIGLRLPIALTVRMTQLHTRLFGHFKSLGRDDGLGVEHQFPTARAADVFRCYESARHDLEEPHQICMGFRDHNLANKLSRLLGTPRCSGYR